MVPLTPWQKFKERWKGGCGSELCGKPKNKIVLARGQVPCDVLFIGEAPGASENIVGKPFVGPAGKLLDEIIEKTIRSATICNKCGTLQFYETVLGKKPDGGPLTCAKGHRGATGRVIRYAMTNLVGCIPMDDKRSKIGQPDTDSVEACQPRLVEFIELCDPSLIVCVGTMARDAMEQGFSHSPQLHKKIPMIDIRHPAYILRQNPTYQPVLLQACRVTLENVLFELTFPNRQP